MRHKAFLIASKTITSFRRFVSLDLLGDSARLGEVSGSLLSDISYHPFMEGSDVIFKDYAMVPIDDEYRFTFPSAVEEWLALPKNKNFFEKQDLPAVPPSLWQEVIRHMQTKKRIEVSFTPVFRQHEEILRGTVQYGSGRHIRAVAEFHGRAGLEVVSDNDAEVVRVDRKDPGLALCGRRVAMKLGNGAVLVYLNLDDITCQVGDRLARGQVFARVAPSATNGGQHTHVGVMAIRGRGFEGEIWETSPLFSGYCVSGEIGPGAFFLNVLDDYVSLGMKTRSLVGVRG